MLPHAWAKFPTFCKGGIYLQFRRAALKREEPKASGQTRQVCFLKRSRAKSSDLAVLTSLKHCGLSCMDGAMQVSLDLLQLAQVQVLEMCSCQRGGGHGVAIHPGPFPINDLALA